MCVCTHQCFPKARQTRKLLVANLKQNMGVRTTLLITVTMPQSFEFFEVVPIVTRPHKDSYKVE